MLEPKITHWHNPPMKERMLMPTISRRDFLARLAALGAGAALTEVMASCAPVAQPTTTPAPTLAPTTVPGTVAPTAAAQATAAPTVAPTATITPAYLAVARGSQPAAITQRAIAALGGIERFMKAGANVIIKPNICIDSYTYEYGATTNPEVVAALVRMCLGAGAKSVRVMDQPFSGTPDSAYARSGIADAVKAAGGQMEIMAPMKFRDAKIPDGRDLKSWRIYGDILDADLVINVPVPKSHGLARLTLAGKNLMGIVEDRGSFHRDIGQRCADVASLVKPRLTVIDAVRIMPTNGPTGGSLDDVKVMNTVIASADWVAADAYATSLFGVKPADIGYIKAGAAMNLGTMDLSAIKIEELQVS
jgi:uncharacterized protein (DUF362 family)